MQIQALLFHFRTVLTVAAMAGLVPACDSEDSIDGRSAVEGEEEGEEAGDEGCGPDGEHKPGKPPGGEGGDKPPPPKCEEEDGECEPPPPPPCEEEDGECKPPPPPPCDENGEPLPPKPEGDDGAAEG